MHWLEVFPEKRVESWFCEPRVRWQDSIPAGWISCWAVLGRKLAWRSLRVCLLFILKSLMKLAASTSGDTGFMKWGKKV